VISLEKGETKEEKAKRERAMAKALSMAVLFESDNFKNIVSFLGTLKETKDLQTAEITLRKKLAKAGLDDIDQRWLGNYLIHYKDDLGEQSDAKWPICEGVTGATW
jgi:hypothetical protein